MKYLFINSVAGVGSTGRIVAETCRKLQQQGHSCVIAYGREMANCDGIETVAIGASLDYKLHGALNRITDRHGFYSRKATKRFLDWVRVYDPDVIWLHNIHGYYLNLELLFGYLKESGKQVKWTLHDCWAFTGHCAYFDFARCDRWKTGCHDCPQKGEYPATFLMDGSRANYQDKKRLFTGLKDVQLYVPSRWLADRVKQSFLKEYPVEVVYNTVNTEVFKPTPGVFRKEQGLEDKKIALGVASIWDRRKGLEDFVTLAGMLDDDWRIVLVGLTPEQAGRMPSNIVCIPRTNSAAALAEIYTAADVFVNLSVEETFGMTTLEALKCGTAPIVYAGTACEEVTRQFGGKAVERGDWEGLLKAMNE